jgi:hypothetical protein
MNLAATEQLLHVPDGMAVGFAITDRVYLRTEIRNAPDDSGEDGLGSNDVIGSALYDRKTLRELVRFADRTGDSPDVLHDCFEPERFAVIDAHGSHLDARSLAPLGLARLRGRFSVTRECFSSEGALLTMAPIQEKSEPEKRRQPFYEQSEVRLLAISLRDGATLGAAPVALGPVDVRNFCRTTRYKFKVLCVAENVSLTTAQNANHSKKPRVEPGLVVIDLSNERLTMRKRIPVRLSPDPIGYSRSGRQVFLVPVGGKAFSRNGQTVYQLDLETGGLTVISIPRSMAPAIGAYVDD